jgi:hypothetical protein
VHAARTFKVYSFVEVLPFSRLQLSFKIPILQLVRRPLALLPVEGR